MIIFNAIGGGLALLAFLATAILANVLVPRSTEDWAIPLLFGVLTLIPDFVLRFRNDDRGFEGWKVFVLPRSGGHVFFIPVWLWGLAAIAAGAVSAVGPAHRPPAAQVAPSTPSPEQAAEMQRVKELEARLKALEAEKAAAERKAARQ